MSLLRLSEFFEGDMRLLSMTRLTIFLSFWPASYVLIIQQSETMLGLYLGAYVLGYVGGKSADIFMGNRKLETDSDSDSSGDDATSRQPLARESKSTRRRKKRPF